jgi:hypothetical protein
LGVAKGKDETSKNVDNFFRLVVVLGIEPTLEPHRSVLVNWKPAWGANCSIKASPALPA